MADGRKCLCCGKTYRYCPSCYKDAGKPSWMALYCSENCKDIFDTANEYFFGHISKKDAKELIEQCDLTNLETFCDVVKHDVEKILQEDIVAKKQQPKAIKEKE